MKKIARDDWKRHSAPHELTFNLSDHRNSLGEVFDQAMVAFTENNEEKRANTVGRERKNTVTSAVLACESIVELSTDEYAPGVLKIFGETVLPGVQYKSVLASCRSTALELVKQALERFGLPLENYKQFVLCDVIGRYVTEDSYPDDSTNFEKWERVYARVLSDKDKPLLLQKFWKPLDGCSRRYELHKRAQLIDLAETDDTSGLNSNARKILISKLRPGAIPLFDPSQGSAYGLINQNFSNRMCSDISSKMSDTDVSSIDSCKGNCICKAKSCSDDKNTHIPVKHPFFLNIRGYDIAKDNVIYPIKYKKFTFGNPNIRNQLPFSDVPKIPLLAPDIEATHCNFKVYKFKRSNGVRRSEMDRYNYFLELEPLGNNVRVNGHKISGKSIVKSGDILNIGIYYVFVFKDCSRNVDIPLALPWLPISELDSEKAVSKAENCDLKLHLYGDDESKSNTDESMEVSIPEKMSFAYKPDKEEELVKYICAIIQQQNTQRTYPLTVAYLFSMCVEYASKKFDRRQLKHLFLRILFTTRENVAGTAKSLSASKFSCNLLDTASQGSEGDKKLERLLLWISNCVQLLLFLKHTFQLPEVLTTEPSPRRGVGDKSPRSPGRDTCSTAPLSSPRKEDSAEHAMAQLVTGLEEIIMFCFQQSVYTLTKALHPFLSALLDSNPFSDFNSEQCSMEDITRMYGALAEVTHAVMLHEGITRQLFTYLFFFTSTNVFNKLITDEKSWQYYNWSSGVRIRANISQLEDWATQNGLEDEFGQMFERLLAASELLATSKNTLVKYQWSMMKDHYQPLTSGQIFQILKQYQLGTRDRPSVWTPSDEELQQIETEEPLRLSLCNHPPFALPDNCGIIDLMRIPEDASFSNHLRRLKALYGVVEDDSDSGFSRSNTPHGNEIMQNEDAKESLVGDEVHQETDHISRFMSSGPFQNKETEVLSQIKEQKMRIPVKKSNTNPWTLRVPRPATGVCKCTTLPQSPPHCQGCKYRDAQSEVKWNATETLFSDLISEETRENMDNHEQCKEPKEKLMNSIVKRTNNVKNSNLEILKVSSNTPGFKSNVSNCSARTTNNPYIRQRSHTVGNDKDLHSCLKKKSTSQSVSMEDVNLPFMYRKPILSASFYEAIERGHGKGPRQTNKVSSNSSQLGSISEGSRKPSDIDKVEADVGTSVKDRSVLGSDRKLIRSYSGELQRQYTNESVLSDDVFAEESVDTFYRKSVKEIHTADDYSFLPETNSFKPISTSSMDIRQSRSQSRDNRRSSCQSRDNRRSSSQSRDNRRSNSQSQKLLAISFDAGAHSSAIELAQNKLYVSGVNDITGNSSGHNEDLSKFVQLNDGFSEGMFVEVNEDVLASRKRHGSSINVVPNSPRLCIKQDLKPVNIDPEEQKQVAPCPLFTVYLRKTGKALGLGLIDGLHTPLRLTGIYIKKILPGSPAALNGCLQVGDRILAVNGVSVIGANYQSTMNLIRAAEDALTLLVARGNDSMARKISSSNV